ncbi:MAG: OmpA family protein [Bacteroidales bacterium]
MFRKVFICIIFILMSFYAFSQNYTISSRRGIKMFHQAQDLIAARSYNEAIPLLKDLVKKYPKFLEAWILLGQTYKVNDYTQEAISALSESIKQDSNFYPRALFLQGELYLDVGDYKNTEIVLKSYISRIKTNHRNFKIAKLFLQKAIFGQQQLESPVPYNPTKLPWIKKDTNSKFVNGVTANDSSIFYTYRVTEKMAQKRPKKFFEYIQIAELNSIDHKWHPVESLKDIFGIPAITGAMSISPKGDEIFFTACGIKPGMGSCDIYYTRKEGKKWSYPINLGSNVNSYTWDSQPSISPDGRTIFFTSRRKGGYGKADLWMCEKDSTGNWQAAKNLGAEINTFGNEFAPFIHADNQTLYFSSDGHVGMGKMDLFVSRRKEDGSWSKPQNLGYPINTHYDEITLVVNTKGEKAYFSSNNLDSTGVVKIYSFDLYSEIQPRKSTYFKAIVKDSKNRNPLKADLQIYSLSENRLIGEYQTNPDNGSVLVILPESANYAINVNKKGYIFYSASLKLDKVSSATKPLQEIIYLDKVLPGKVFTLNNIYFPTNEFTIDPKSEFELNKLFMFMEINPDVEILIKGHTDNVGGKEYNLQLSEKRANSVAQYLISKGINKNRIQKIGLGDTQHIASNDTEKGRNLNRRTEVEIRK